MRKKVRKSLAFLLALALVVSVMSGLGLSVSADDAQNEPVVTETEGEPAEEKLKAEESTPKEGEKEEEADPDAEAVPEEKKDEQKAEGEGSGDAVKDTTADSNGNQKDEPQAEPAAEEPAEPVEQASVPIVQAAAGEVRQYTITCGNQSLTVKLVDDSDKPVKGSAPKNLTIEKDTATSVNGYVAEVEDYTYYGAYYYDTYYGQQKYDVTKIAYLTGREPGWYSVGNYGRPVKIDNDTIYLVYAENSAINDTFTIHYVDENGKEIGKKTQPVTVNGDKTIVFNKWAEDIPGYTYWRACYSSANNAEVTKMVKKQYHSYIGPSYYANVFYNGTTELTAGTEEISDLKDIYLVYVKNGGGPGTGGGTTGGGGALQTPSHEKKATQTGDGTYDLSLSVSGSVGNSTQKAMVDIIYVLDKSNSMDADDMAVTGNDGSTKNIKRLTAANDAIKALTSSLTAEDSLIDARFALVTFSTHSSKETFSGENWTKNSTTLTKALPSKPSSGNEGGTNYEAGLKNAKMLLDDTRQNATTVVIFLSDGVPTFYVDGGTGQGDKDGRAMSKARGIVKQMTPNYLFTVGVGDPDNYSNLGLVTDAAHSGVATDNYVGNNNENLKKAFDDMKGKITSIACQNVTISDKLSANVAMVMADGKPKKPVGKVTDKDGHKVGTYNSDGTITLRETELNKKEFKLPAPVYEDGTIKWVFPPEYKLEANYTYTVTANVDVTETAFEHYRKGINENSNRYPDTPDAGTGTHANDKGLFSNDNENAKLIYTVTGESEPKKVNYQKPVVQLTPSKLTIKKTVTGLDKTALEKLKSGLKFKVTYKYKNNGTKNVEVGFDKFIQEGNTNTYTYTSDDLKCWSMDADYTVAEEYFVVEGYDHTGGDTTVSGKIEGKNRDVTETFTNAYTPSNRTITLKKVVAGNMGDTKKTFHFTATNATITGDGNLANGKTTTITAKVGQAITIKEDDYTSAGYTTTASADGTGVNDNTKGTYDEGNHSYTITVTKEMNEDTIITFTNDKTINPPNGIITTIAPYAIMVVLAAGAGVYFVYSRRRRNR